MSRHAKPEKFDSSLWRQKMGQGDDYDDANVGFENAVIIIIISMDGLLTKKAGIGELGPSQLVMIVRKKELLFVFSSSIESQQANDFQSSSICHPISVKWNFVKPFFIRHLPSLLDSVIRPGKPLSAGFINVVVGVPRLSRSQTTPQSAKQFGEFYLPEAASSSTCSAKASVQAQSQRVIVFSVEIPTELWRHFCYCSEHRVWSEIEVFTNVSSLCLSRSDVRSLIPTLIKAKKGAKKTKTKSFQCVQSLKRSSRSKYEGLKYEVGNARKVSLPQWKRTTDEEEGVK